MSDDWGEGSLPAEMPAQRASDDDRMMVITRLRDAVGAGVLDLDELEERIGLVYAAKTLPDLVPITADLPAPRPATPAPPRATPFDVPALRDNGFQHHLTVYVMVIGMLIGIWLLSGAGHFWPFYPAAGWGIGLASHFMGVNQAVRRREERARRGEPPELDSGDDRHTAQRERRRAQEEAREERHRARDLARDQRRGGPGRPAPPKPPIPPTLPAEPSPATPAAPATPPVAPAQPSADSRRRFVVAMFVDVVGSTELNEALGDESWSRVRERYRELLAECFEAEGGWEVNVAGDGVLARFDDPSASVRAAIQIQRRLERRRADSGFAPSVRIGIHSGDVMTDGEDLIGSVVNLASRVTSAAEPDEIFVTEHVADHLSGSLVAEGRGLHTLKGVGRPRHLMVVRWR